MKTWSKPEVVEMNIKETAAVTINGVTYYETDENYRPFGAYYYFDGIKNIYVNELPEDVRS